MLGVRTKQQYVFRIISPTQRMPIDVAATDLSELEDWMRNIQGASVKADHEVHNNDSNNWFLYRLSKKKITIRLSASMTFKTEVT